MDTITAQRRICLPQRPLDSPEVGSEWWSYDDAEENVYGELAEVEHNGAIKTASSLSTRPGRRETRRYAHHDEEG